MTIFSLASRNVSPGERAGPARRSPKRCTGCIITPGYTDFILGKGGEPIEVDTSGVWSRALTDARGVTSWYKNTIVSSVGGIPGVSGETASPFMPAIGANSGGLIFCWDQIGGAVLPDFDSPDIIQSFAMSTGLDGSGEPGTGFGLTNCGACLCRGSNASSADQKISAPDPATGIRTAYDGNYWSPEADIKFNPGITPEVPLGVPGGQLKGRGLKGYDWDGVPIHIEGEGLSKSEAELFRHLAAYFQHTKVWQELLSLMWMLRWNGWSLRIIITDDTFEGAEGTAEEDVVNKEYKIKIHRSLFDDEGGFGVPREDEANRLIERLGVVLWHELQHIFHFAEARKFYWGTQGFPGEPYHPPEGALNPRPYHKPFDLAQQRFTDWWAALVDLKAVNSYEWFDSLAAAKEWVALLKKGFCGYQVPDEYLKIHTDVEVVELPDGRKMIKNIRYKVLRDVNFRRSMGGFSRSDAHDDDFLGQKGVLLKSYLKDGLPYFD